MQKKDYRPTLPTSLKKKRIVRIVIRSTIFITLLSILIFVAIMWGNKLFPTTHQHISGYKDLKIIFYTIFFTIPFIITGIPFKIIDTSWSGTVTDIKIIEKLDTTSNPKYIYTFPKQNLTLYIKTDKGKEVKYTILSLSSHAKPGYEIKKKGDIYYHEHEISIGDRVHKYYGYKHLFVSYKKPQQTKYCICCGVKNSINEINCWHCKSVLLTDNNEGQNT